MRKISIKCFACNNEKIIVYDSNIVFTHVRCESCGQINPRTNSEPVTGICNSCNRAYDDHLWQGDVPFICPTEIPEFPNEAKK